MEPNRVTPLPPAPAALTIQITPESPEADAARAAQTDTKWAEIVAANPHAFDGGILAFDRYDPETNTIHTQRDRYARLAVQPEVANGIKLLAVTGVLLARDAAGAWDVCLGMRSDSTRLYPGLWEFAPSGGIDPPTTSAEPATPESHSGALAIAALHEEAEEELGLCLPELRSATNAVHVLALADDPAASSIDVVLAVELNKSAEMFHVEHADAHTQRNSARWEYHAVRWVPMASLPDFVRREPCIPTTVDLVDAGLLARWGCVSG